MLFQQFISAQNPSSYIAYDIFYCRLKPREDEWNELNQIKIPLLLNLAQCKLLSKEYYQVIEHCTTILNDDPGAYTYLLLY